MSFHVSPVAAEDGAPGWVAKVEPASDDASQVIARFRPAQGFKVDLFAAEPRLANPVAFHIDEKGRFYVVETFRFKGGVLDIRDKMAWLDEDTASRTLAMRRKMVTDHLGPEGVKSWEQASDRVKLIEDRDGDGKADHDSVFTAGDNKLEDGVASGILAHYGDVYYANIPSLYLLRDKDGDGKAEYKDALQTGYGVRYNFLGHDLHGLRFGPDGKLYFSIGDRGTHLEKSVDGKLVSDPDRGAVFRCDPDGSNIEIVHTGLRNPQELAFDEYGNLFTGDNNSDGGDQARWVQIAEGGDSGWRVGYQNQEFPGNRGPWNFELIWKPDGQQPAKIYYRLPPISNPLPISGPSGLTYTPGTGMPKDWEKTFLLCDFRGGPGNSGIYGIQNKPKGATFEMTMQRLIGGCLPTDVEFGYDGGVYFSDWTNGWELPGRGRLYHLFDAPSARVPIVKQTAELMKAGFAQREPAELAKLLEHPDMRVRQEAQFTLAGKGAASIETLAGVAAKNASQLARLHAVWGLGQISRKSPEALKPVLPLLADPDDEVRAQAAKVVGDARLEDAYEPLVKLLADKGSRVRYFAAQSLAKIGNPACVAQVATLLRENNDQDAYLRHAGVMALVGAGSKDMQSILSLAKDESPAVRMGVLLALRRMQKAEIAQFLTDKEGDLVLEAARAINDEPVESAQADLAKLLDTDLPQKSRRDEMVLMRAINANYRLGTAESAERLARYAANDRASEAFRVDALRLLGEWQHVPGRDHIVGVWRALSDRDPAVAKTAVTPALRTILAGKASDGVRAAAATLVGRLGVDDAAVLTQLAGSQKLTPQVRAAAMSSLASANDPRAADAIKAGLSDKDEPVRLEAIRLARRLPDGMETLARVVETGTTKEKQAALEALGSAPATGHAGAITPDSILEKTMDQLLGGSLRGEMVLDLLDAVAARKTPELKAKLKQFEDSRGTDELAQYKECLQGGDKELGYKIFLERADVSCLKCHAVNKQGGNAGPDLAGVGGKHERAYLLESLILPQKTIAPGFETIIIRNKKGDVVTGVLKSETDTEVVLDIPEKGPLTIKKADIDKRKGGQSAMPPDISKTLSKRDVRNLVEWLYSLK